MSRVAKSLSRELKCIGGPLAGRFVRVQGEQYVVVSVDRIGARITPSNDMTKLPTDDARFTYEVRCAGGKDKAGVFQKIWYLAPKDMSDLEVFEAIFA